MDKSIKKYLSEIGRRESIEADKDRLDKEVTHAKQHVPNADEGALRAHIAHALRNEKVLEFLEGF